MQLITSEAEFAAILEMDRAIVFLDFAWSGQAGISAAAAEEWERTSHLWRLDCLVFKVRPDDLPAAAEWMGRAGKDLAGEGGYGSLVWLSRGTILDYEPYALGAGLRDISRRTRAAFKGVSGASARWPLWDRELDG
ncbi:hypothetical protein OJF2_41250 [Aquisphaera giovannonii]|uniref:Uncharacterized protein n=1 Tax=Aquisphaera giovannonii TaxID=406548 RepID=A0A5B9W4S7_9BACT|nr:hypothetical protein [Aquisphaera giovannonii]QEH35572.1 hypothetical protein OJF2_41250 [Aquisphaera giovannonii]